MAKYTKKPITIDAFRFGFDKTPEWFDAKVAEGDARLEPNGDSPEFAKITTLEGTLKAQIGDWIAKGIKGEIYPIKHEIFVGLYDPAEPEAQKGKN